MADKTSDKEKKEYKRLVRDAKLVSKVAHSAIGQRRKYTNAPYYHHPDAVATILSGEILTREGVGNVALTTYSNMMAAAYLHDVVEDTHISSAFISEHFNEEVGRLVRELTKGKYDLGMTRFQKTVAELKRISRISYQAKQIKVCDICCNTSDLFGAAMYADEFNITYLAEQLAKLLVIEGSISFDEVPKTSQDERFLQVLFRTKDMVYDRISKVSRVQSVSTEKETKDHLILLKASRLMVSYCGESDTSKYAPVDKLMTAYKSALVRIDAELAAAYRDTAEECQRDFLNKWIAK